MSARSAAFFSSSRIFFLLGATTYLGLKPFFGSTPSADFGRSRMCPIEAFTMNFESRYFWIVFTFVGDSTTTRARLPVATRRSPLPVDGGRHPALALELTGPAPQLQANERRRRPGGRKLCARDERFYMDGLVRSQQRQHTSLLAH